MSKRIVSIIVIHILLACSLLTCAAAEETQDDLQKFSEETASNIPVYSPETLGKSDDYIISDTFYLSLGAFEGIDAEIESYDITLKPSYENTWGSLEGDFYGMMTLGISLDNVSFMTSYNTAFAEYPEQEEIVAKWNEAAGENGASSEPFSFNYSFQDDIVESVSKDIYYKYGYVYLTIDFVSCESVDLIGFKVNFDDGTSIEIFDEDSSDWYDQTIYKNKMNDYFLGNDEYVYKDSFRYIFHGEGENRTVEITEFIGNEKNVTVPGEIDGAVVETLREELFAGSEIEELTISEGVKEIEREAFYYASFLTKVTLPSTLESIGEDAFWSTDSLTSIEVDSKNPNFTSYNGVLFSKDMTKLVYCGGGVESFDIPDGVQIIGNTAFGDNNVITKVTIPDSVRIIEDSAFNWCYMLQDLSLPSKLEYIGTGAFGMCGSIREWVIPKTVTYIGDEAFYRFDQDYENVTIYCYKNTVAYDYAIEKGFNCVVLSVLGDVNDDGNITAIDARLILQNAAGNYEFDETVKLAADVNRDENVTAIDARLVLQAAAGNVKL